MCRYKNNCTTVGLLKPGMIINYHDEELKIIKLLERKLTPKGLICKYQVKGGGGILAAHSGLRVNLTEVTNRAGCKKRGIRQYGK